MKTAVCDRPILSVVRFATCGLLIRRRHWRAAGQGVVATLVALSTVGMVLQQTRADVFLVEGWPRLRDFVPARPSMAAVLWENIRLGIRGAAAALPEVIHEIAGEGGTASAQVGNRAGAPWPWQASDAAAPNTIVNLANGNAFTAIPIVSWQDVSFMLYHNSYDISGLSTLSTGWTHSYSAHLTFGVDEVTYHADDGATVVFTGTDDGASDQRVFRMRLERDDLANEWSVIMDSQHRRVFDSTGRLLRLKDASGATVQLSYAGDRLTQIVDAAGRALTLGYEVDGKLRNVTAPPFRKGSDDAALVQRVFEFDYSAQSRLEKIWSPRRDALNQPVYHIELGYDANSRLTSASDYQGHTTDLVYDAAGRTAQAVHPPVFDYVLNQSVRTSRRYAYLEPCTAPPHVEQPSGPSFGEAGAAGEERGAPTCAKQPTTTVTDERGRETRYIFDEDVRLIGIRDPLNRMVGRFGWNSINRLTHSRNVLGAITIITYNDNGDPLTTTTHRGTTQTTYDALHNLTQVVDPVGQATDYFYEDADNPTRMTRMKGPGDADETLMQWGCGSAAHKGMLAQMSDPNRTTQGFQYEGRNVVRRLSENVNPMQCPGGNGGDTEECATIDNSIASNQTGESRVTGDETCIPITGSKSEDCLSQDPIELGPTCKVCGCAVDYDEAGSVINLSGGGCTHEGPVASAGGLSPIDPPASLEGNLPEYCGGLGQPFQYDGNQHLTCAWDREDSGGDRWSIRNQFSYDARGRLQSAAVFAEETVIPAQYLYPHVQVYPSYEVDYEYSDTTGAFRYEYERVLQEGLAQSAGLPSLPEPSVRTFTTTYRRDAAGRVSRIERTDGDNTPIQATTYAYTDSTVAPAVTETKPDGSKSLVYLDLDGLVRRIVHTNPSGTTLASFEYTRDAKGRIILVAEEVLDSQAADGYRSDRVAYAYGDGHLGAADLDNPAAAVPNPDRLYYDYLATLGGGRALQSQDPNRLVMERRFNEDADDVGTAVTYKREYWYDPGGNRLAMRESAVGATPAQDTPVAVTRYNYHTTNLEETGSATQMPGTPIASSGLRLDYLGGGRNQLLSSQRYFVDDPDQVEVTAYSYSQETQADAGAMIEKMKRVWRRGNGGAWFELRNAATFYSYRKGQLEKVNTYANDFCPSVPECGTCDAPCETVEHTAFAEFYAYDIFGRRVASSHCDDANGQPTSEFYSCKWQTTMYDYDGLSQNVLAVRRSPVLGSETLTPDRYLSTFTYGPMGIVTRTEEFGNADPSDNVDHYYLADAMGGNAAMYLDHDGDAMTPRILQSQVHDAFGNLMSDSIEATAEYAWRGTEGSETDHAPNLVLMQARHYDPELGRFLQADALPIASITTQGMNRYIYCENDPVNASDPSGRHPAIGLLLLLAVGVAAVAALLLIGFVAILAYLFNLLIRGTCWLVGNEDTYDNLIDWFAQKLLDLNWWEVATDIGVGIGLSVLAAIGVISGGMALVLGIITAIVINWVFADARIESRYRGTHDRQEGRYCYRNRLHRQLGVPPSLLDVRDFSAIVMRRASGRIA